MPPDTDLPAEAAPSRYIEKVSLLTGEVLDEPVLPRHLLVHSHRDYHVMDVQARLMMSRVMRATGDPELARQKVKDLRRLGHKASRMLAKAIGGLDPEKVAKTLFGLKERQYYFRFKKQRVASDEIARRVTAMREQAAERLATVTGADGRPALRVLLTGGTGFVGQEILWQAAHDDIVAEVVVLIRPQEVRDRKTREVVATRSPAERGERLLDRLWLTTAASRRKFRFVGGDVEAPRLGVGDEEFSQLAGTLTHVIHCAASVSFDDPYLKSYRANVSGTLNALAFSLALQSAPGSPFVAHLAIETSYIHGRQRRQEAQEDEIVFPRNFYNNYYELTKAMASIETERFMLEARAAHRPALPGHRHRRVAGRQQPG